MREFIRPSMKELVNFCITRGFVYPSSEIYGGLANTWDYGPLGVEIKKKIKDLWWKTFIQSREDMVGMDGAILMNPRIWEASGHVGGFSDPLVECKQCHMRFRADNLLQDQFQLREFEGDLAKLQQIFDEKDVVCPNCKAMKNFTPIRNFQLMFRTYQGVVEDQKDVLYLRPETAQEIFVQFKNILQSTRKKLPMGVGQIGKSFRNEVTPGNFIFRTREFEQMEIEYFFPKGQMEVFFEEWVKESMRFFTSILEIPRSMLQIRDQSDKELAHYSKRTCDIEFSFPFGWGEIAGIAHRGDYDLKAHENASGESLAYMDPYTNEKYLPEVIEPSFGVDRAFLALMTAHYVQEILDDGKSRFVLRIPRHLAPISIAILPLKKNEPDIVRISKKLLKIFSNDYSVIYDDTGSIGKLYRRQDEIGTPFCITVDFDTITDSSVTVRERDSMQQTRIHIEKLPQYFEENFKRENEDDDSIL